MGFKKNECIEYMRKTKKRKPIFVPFLIYGSIFHEECEVIQPFVHIE